MSEAGRARRGLFRTSHVMTHAGPSNGVLDHLPPQIDNSDTGSALSGAHSHHRTGCVRRTVSRSSNPRDEQIMCDEIARPC
jgi:hypothetical protein